MKELLALSGPKDSGKTTTIKAYYELLKTKYPTAKTSLLSTTVDIQVIIDISGIRIGIESQGDTTDPTYCRIVSSLNYLSSEGCSIIVCAIRTKGCTVDFINEFSANKKYNMEIIKKNKFNTSHSNNRNNKRCADYLLKSTAKFVSLYS